MTPEECTVITRVGNVVNGALLAGHIEKEAAETVMFTLIEEMIECGYVESFDFAVEVHG